MKISELLNGILAIVALCMLLTIGTGCNTQSNSSTPQNQIVTVQRGDILDTVTSDGTLVMPREVQLRFGTSGTVKEVLVREGDFVRAGTLLAKLDDSSQRIDIESANYDLQQTLSNLYETVAGIHQIRRYPCFDPHESALWAFRETQKGVGKAHELLKQGKYELAISELRIAIYILDSSTKVLEATTQTIITDPELAEGFPCILPYEQPCLGMYTIEIKETIELINRDRESLINILHSIEQGDYTEALSSLNTIQRYLVKTERVLEDDIGRLERRYIDSCPDMATVFNFFRAAEERLEDARQIIEQEVFDYAAFTEVLRMINHDIEMASYILEGDVLVLKHGLSLKDTQTYNLNLEKSIVALYDKRENFMKTEILAPFDGTIVDVGLDEDDQLSANDYSSKTAVHLVDTKTIEMNGTVDEVDILKINRTFNAKRKVIAASTDEALFAARNLEYPLRVFPIDLTADTPTELIHNEQELNNHLSQDTQYPIIMEEVLKANITLDALADEEFIGWITFISPSSSEESNVVSYAVTITLDPTEVELKGGLTATADIIIQEAKNVLLIPAYVITKTSDGNFVDVVTDETVMRTDRRQIFLGIQTYQFVEVISGLNEGEKILVPGKSNNL